jgi:hypothetical protein
MVQEDDIAPMHAPTHHDTINVYRRVVTRLAFSLWDPANLSGFRTLALTASALSACGIYVGTGVMLAHVKEQQRLSGSSLSAASTQHGAEKAGGGGIRKELSLWRFARGVAGHRNFLRFVAMNAVLEAENVLHGQFRKLFVDLLLGELPQLDWHRPAKQQAMLLGSLFVSVCPPNQKPDSVGT